MGILVVTPYPPDLSMSVMCECVESWSRWVPPHPPPGLRASGGLHLGVKPPFLYSLPVQMPKLCAATGFELLETD